MLVLYRLLGYAAFAVSFTALILASTGLALVPAIDRPPALGAPVSVAIDVALIALFAVQHTIMARAWFKRAFARVLPAGAERSTFVLASSLCVGAMAFGWAPIAGDLWRLDGVAAIVVRAIAIVGFLFAGASTFAFDHLELFGLRAPREKPQLSVPLFYRLVRHPMMLGMLVGFWSAPRMTVGHLVFALGMTAYIVAGVRYEERDLVRVFGDEYVRYRERVPALLPWPRFSDSRRS